MNLHDRVREAIIHAPIEGQAPSADVYFMHSGAPDDTPIHLDPYSRPDKAGEVTLDWLAFPNALFMLAEVHAELFGKENSHEDVRNLDHHEVQHIEVARILGASSIRVGLQYTRSSEGSRFGRVEALARFPNFRTTRLGAALIAIYPTEPSPQDIMIAKGLNYSGVQQVGRAVGRFNRSHRASQPQYPFPLSYRSRRFFAAN